MTIANADEIWESSEPFENQVKPTPNTRTKKKSGTEAEIVLPEPEEIAAAPETGDVIDGSEDDISKLEEQDETAPLGVNVDHDDRARTTVDAVAPNRSRKEMAEKKTKAEMIRDEITRRKEKGEEQIRPRDVIATLESKGVTVAAPQVSVALRDFGKTNPSKPAKTSKSAKLVAAVTASEKTERSRATAKLAAASVEKSAPAANGPSYSALEAAAAFVHAQGGLDRAKGLLEAYSRLIG